MATTLSEVVEPKIVRWSQEQYHRMAEMDWFDGKRVELIEGEIVEMSPMKSAHWAAVVLADHALRPIFEPEYIVSIQLPISLGPTSEPEPDLAVIPGNVRDYVNKLPATAQLVIEVSDTTLAFDRATKAALYAKANIAEYWIINLVESVLEVRREPVANTYQSVQTLTKAQSVSPLGTPNVKIKVADLLP